MLSARGSICEYRSIWFQRSINMANFLVTVVCNNSKVQRCPHCYVVLNSIADLMNVWELNTWYVKKNQFYEHILGKKEILPYLFKLSSCRHEIRLSWEFEPVSLLKIQSFLIFIFVSVCVCVCVLYNSEDSHNCFSDSTMYILGF